jgi:hypothetical protein
MLGLIEREVNNNMMKDGRKSTQIYHGFRPSQSKITDRILGDFSMVQM